MNNPEEQIDLDELCEWIESRPELSHIRKQADEALAMYRPGEDGLNERIRISKNRTLNKRNQGFSGGLKEAVWVPGRKLRGNSYSTPSIDGTANTTAKMLSISTLWDFVCTLPLFTFGLAPLGVAALPGAVTLSFLILWASNVAGEKSTDRRDSIHALSATLSISAFMLLSLAKTAFSGVGVDLVLGSRTIQERYASELATEKLDERKQELARLDEGGPQLQVAAAKCQQFENDLNRIDRATNEKAFQSLFVRAYGSKAQEAADQGLTPQQVIQKYGSIGQVPGACRRQKILRQMNIEKASDIRGDIDEKSILINSKPPLDYLREQEPDTYKAKFRDSGDNIEWVSGTTAVSQATDQFWDQLLKGEFGLLGFSLLFLIISIVLSIAASLMLIQLSRSPQIKASFDEELRKLLGDRMSMYSAKMRERLKDEEEN